MSSISWFWLSDPHADGDVFGADEEGNPKRMIYVLFFLVSVFFAAPAIWFIYHELYSAENGLGAGLRCIIRPERKFTAAWFLAAGGGFALAAVSYRMYGGDSWRYVRLLFVYHWLIPAAYLDGRMRRIPNSWILCGLGAGIVFCLLEGGRNGEWTAGVSGALVGAGLLMIGSLLRKGGMGMGDVKLYLVLGLITGPQGIVHILLIALACALVYSLVMMASGRITWTDQVPMGPFTWLAMMAAALVGLG